MTADKLLVKVYILLIIAYFLVIVVGNFGLIPAEIKISRLIAMPLLFVSILYFFIYIPFFTKRTLKISFFKYITIFVFIYTSYYLLSLINIQYYSNNLDYSTQVRVYFTALLWMFGFVNFFTLGYKNQIKPKSMEKTAIILYILATLVIYSSIYYELKGGDTINTASGYTVLMIMPLLMYLFKNRISQILILTIGITLISGKRGALVIEAVILLYYVLNKSKIKVKQKKTSFAGSLVILLAIIGIGFYAYNFVWDSLQTRFSDVFIGTAHSGEIYYGSGRNVFWFLSFSDWYKSSLFNNFFGLGFYSTASALDKLYGTPIQAHNDYIEILHCFGVFGVIIFILFQVKLYSFIKRITSFSVNRFILFTALIILVGRGLFAGVLYRPDTLLLAIAFGFITGDLYKNKFEDEN